MRTTLTRTGSSALDTSCDCVGDAKFQVQVVPGEYLQHINESRLLQGLPQGVPIGRLYVIFLSLLPRNHCVQRIERWTTNESTWYKPAPRNKSQPSPRPADQEQIHERPQPSRSHDAHTSAEQKSRCQCVQPKATILSSATIPRVTPCRPQPIAQLPAPVGQVTVTAVVAIDVVAFQLCVRGGCAESVSRTCYERASSNSIQNRDIVASREP